MPFNPEDMRRVRAQIATAEDLFQRPTPLLKAYGVAVLADIQDTFKVGGKPARWKPLSDWTKAGRRQGRGSGGARPLQDTGSTLRRGRAFDMRVGARHVEVFDTSPTVKTKRGQRSIAAIHERGAGPFFVRPKPGKTLAFPALQRGRGGGVRGQRSLAGLGRARATGTGAFILPTGQRRLPFKNVQFAAGEVGPITIPARPMLPDPRTLGPELVKTGERLLAKAILRRAAR